MRYVCFRLPPAPAVTQATPPSVTTSALAALSGVRHCDGLAGEQNSSPLASDTVAERTAVTRPTPSAPSDFCTAPCEQTQHQIVRLTFFTLFLADNSTTFVAGTHGTVTPQIRSSPR